MSTDLSGILKAVGVECEELDAYLAIDYEFSDKRWWEITDDAHAAFLALARLVAKYKWQRDDLLSEATEVGRAEGFYFHESEEANRADIDRRWEKHDATS